MTRYDLIVKKVDGCASAKVEKHESGSFVKYVDAVERIAELEGVLRDITNDAKEVLTNARNTPAVRRQLEMSGSVKHYIMPRHSIINAKNHLKEQGE